MRGALLEVKQTAKQKRRATDAEAGLYRAQASDVKSLAKQARAERRLAKRALWWDEKLERDANANTLNH